VRYDGCSVCGKPLNDFEVLISTTCGGCTRRFGLPAQDDDDELLDSFFILAAHEYNRQIEGWLLGPPTASDERARAGRIEELLAA
jgi:hypothetical protein